MSGKRDKGASTWSATLSNTEEQIIGAYNWNESQMPDANWKIPVSKVIYYVSPLIWPSGKGKMTDHSPVSLQF